MADFVLVHGAMHAGWFWQPVQEILVSRGHRVVAPDLAGAGDDLTPSDLVDLDMMSRRIVDVVDAHGRGEPVVLVGHGMGGLVIAEAAERAPDRVFGLVFVAGVLVPPGECVLEAIGVDISGRLPFVSRGTDRMRVDVATATRLFYEGASPRDRADRAARRITPQVVRPLIEPTTTTAHVFGRIHRAYVECLQDRALTIERQRVMQRALPCDPVSSLEADHAPTFSAETLLADALEAAAAEFEARGPAFGRAPDPHVPQVPDELVL